MSGMPPILAGSRIRHPDTAVRRRHADAAAAQRAKTAPPGAAGDAKSISPSRMSTGT